MGQIGQGAGGVDVDEDQMTGETLSGEGGEQDARLGRLLFGWCAFAGKHRDVFGLEEGGEVVFVHGVFLPG